MSDYLTKRRAARGRFEDADAVIEHWDKSAREGTSAVPPMEATPEDLAMSATAEMTVSCLWVAWMFGHCKSQGYAVLHDAMAKVSLYKNWDAADRERLREAFPELHDSLDQLMDWV